MNTYKLYKIVSPSGKVYIGQSINIKTRFAQYKRKNCKTQTLLYNTILKYGWENLEKSIIFDFKSKQEVNIKEIELIKYYKNLKISLNLATGGDGGGVVKPIYQLDKQGNIIKLWDCLADISFVGEELRSALIGKSRSNYYKGFLWVYEDNFNKGIIKFSKSCDRLFLLNRFGEKIDEYDTVKEAANKYRTTINSIRISLNKPLFRNSDKIWCYESKFNNILKTEEFINFFQNNKKVKRKGWAKPILQYSLNNEFIKEWDNAFEIEKELNISLSYLFKHLRNEFKQCKGFIFKYK